MSFHLYYNNYERVERQKIVSEEIPLSIARLLREKELPSSAKVFLESLNNFYEVHSGLTKKQFSALKDIQSRIVERASKRHEKWSKKYDSEKKQIARICAEYYKANPPYFSSLAENILGDPDFVPTQNQYKSMCENKYAKKVIEATFTEALYTPGEIVQGRVTAPQDVKDVIFTVIQSNDRPVVRAAKGAKTYLVLPLRNTNSVKCEERHLKKVRKDLTKIK